MNNAVSANNGEIILYQPEGAVHIEVRLEKESVWLTQQQMAMLFAVKENTITYHLKEIFKSEELLREPTTQKIRVVRLEGSREISRLIEFFNLDVIISVGFREEGFCQGMPKGMSAWNFRLFPEHAANFSVPDCHCGYMQGIYRPASRKKANGE